MRPRAPFKTHFPLFTDLKTWVTLEASIAGNGNTIERSYPAVGALRRFGYFRVRRE